MGTESPGHGAATQARPQATTYRLFIRLRRPCRIVPGRLGPHRFPAGWYVYTGSARRNLPARVRRHLARDKTLRWHVDWLLARAEARVHWVELHAAPECAVNRAAGGRIVVPGFGASDCRAGCGSHLRHLGTARPAAVPGDAAVRRAALRCLRAGRMPDEGESR